MGTKGKRGEKKRRKRGAAPGGGWVVAGAGGLYYVLLYCTLLSPSFSSLRPQRPTEEKDG